MILFFGSRRCALDNRWFFGERTEEFRGRFLSGMHTNPCKSLQEYGDGNLENVLTAHIIVSSVGRQASNRMQPTDPTDLAAKWGIILEAARLTL